MRRLLARAVAVEGVDFMVGSIIIILLWQDVALLSQKRCFGDDIDRLRDVGSLGLVVGFLSGNGKSAERSK